MRKVDILKESSLQPINDYENGAIFPTVNLKYANSQVKLCPDTTKNCNGNIVSGVMTDTNRIEIGF